GILVELTQNVLEAIDLRHGFTAVLAQTGGDVVIVLQAVQLTVDQRQGLMLHAMRVLQAGDENLAQHVVGRSGHGGSCCSRVPIQPPRPRMAPVSDTGRKLRNGAVGRLVWPARGNLRPRSVIVIVSPR